MNIKKPAIEIIKNKSDFLVNKKKSIHSILLTLGYMIKEISILGLDIKTSSLLEKLKD